MAHRMAYTCGMIVVLMVAVVVAQETATKEAPPKEAPAKRTPDVVYVPTPNDVAEKMLELAKVTKTDVVYDLGCGDGRIVVTAAKKYGCRGVGFDINPVRVKESLENVEKNNVGQIGDD